MFSQNYIVSSVLVLVQFACLALIALTGNLFPDNILLLLLEIAGIALGIWAILSMGIGNFGIRPEPLEKSVIITKGAYRWIRHPMYLALLLTTLPLVIADFSYWRLGIWLVLLIDLLIKLNYEERILLSTLTGYQEYRQQSYRLIPFVY
jgi:protein-S-isoprenylcysteine O-methyltransferase Ste14